MGSEAEEADPTEDGAVDFDDWVSWEEFFGTSSEDLATQLLSMFDELAGRDESGDIQQTSSGRACNIPVAIKRRLNLVSPSQRSSILGQFRTSDRTMLNAAPSSSSSMETIKTLATTRQGDKIVRGKYLNTKGHTRATRTNEKHVNTGDTFGHEMANRCDQVIVEEPIYQREKSNIIASTPLVHGRRFVGRDNINKRPHSGSSIASSTSSSCCSNQGNANAANPYLTSVESLTDTCASSQGSADSGVITISEASCRIHDVDENQRRNSSEVETSIDHRPRYSDPHRNPVERVLLEIVDTEAIYVEHLRQVIQGYLIFWRDDPAGLVRELQLNDLFSNIEDIFEFNREFLKEIETCGLDPVCVANIFIKRNAGFKVYTEYCTNYPRTVSVLTDLMGQETTANACRERQAALGHALPLGSFLLKPVQRILKYHLLLENMSKEYGAGCEQNGKKAEGLEAIEGALEAMTGIAKHINAMKRRHEHAVRVQEIQSLLYGWPGPDLTTSGELIAEGSFRMRGARGPRHAFLFERMLLMTKMKEDGLLVYKVHIMCSNLMLIESIPGEPCSFHVIPFDNPRLQYILQARNVEQKKEWAFQIKRVILENYNAVIPSHARQLVLQLGQSQQDEDSLTERGCVKKQYSAPPEYLEKRKQEKERRKTDTGLSQKLKKNLGKSDNSNASTKNSPSSSSSLSSSSSSSSSWSSSSSSSSSSSQPRKKPREASLLDTTRDRSLTRSLDARASRVKDRFANWRRKSEPGFQSYVSFERSNDDENDDDEDADADADADEIVKATNIVVVSSELTIDDSVDSLKIDDSADVHEKSSLNETKDTNEQQQQQQQQQCQPKQQQRTVEQIVGHILMQNQEFQRLLEKQRNNSAINVRNQQRFNGKHLTNYTSDESDTENTNYPSEINITNKKNKNNNNNSSSSSSSSSKDNRNVRTNRRENRIIRTNNAWNAFSSPQPRDVQPTLRLRYDNLRNEISDLSIVKTNDNEKNRLACVNDKRAIFEAFKRQSIVTDSKIIKTALRMRESSINQESKSPTRNTLYVNKLSELTKNSSLKSDDSLKLKNLSFKHDNSLSSPENSCKTENSFVKTENSSLNPSCEITPGSFGNYDNLEKVWEVIRANECANNESPTRPAVWLKKLCSDNLPLAASSSPQKADSLPRGFPTARDTEKSMRSRFLQRDGRPIAYRPFTIASDKPAEINLDDMERYASACKTKERIAKFPNVPSAASLSVFYVNRDDDNEENDEDEDEDEDDDDDDEDDDDDYDDDESLTDARSVAKQRVRATSTNVHPNHKIYRENVVVRTGTRRLVSRNENSTPRSLGTTMSTETLVGNDEYARKKYSGVGSTLLGGARKIKKSIKPEATRLTCLGIDDNDRIGCVNVKVPAPPPPTIGTKKFESYYKQGSSGLGARIAQSDYADPSFLFSDGKRAELASNEALLESMKINDKSPVLTCDRDEIENDNFFYERCFETIENYVDDNGAFRDSAIFSDSEEVMSLGHAQTRLKDCDDGAKYKIPPAVPAKRRNETTNHEGPVGTRYKPAVAEKPCDLEIRGKIIRERRRIESRVDEHGTRDEDARINNLDVCVVANGREDDDTSPGRLTMEERSSDVSAGQSQAGWVRKMVGQLQAHMET